MDIQGGFTELIYGYSRMIYGVNIWILKEDLRSQYMDIQGGFTESIYGYLRRMD